MRFTILALLFFACAASAEIQGFCGNLDFRVLTNDQLTDILFTNDLTAGRPNARGQCGLPGENLAICSSCLDQPSHEMMIHLRTVTSQPAHLRWHERWHKIRAVQTIDNEVFEKLRSSNDVPADADVVKFNSQYLNQGSLSGENFFFMHRMMIKMLQMEFASAGLPCIAPWKELPATSSDPVWPVPKGGEYERWQTELTKLQNELANVRRPARLKNLTLNQLGRIVEAGFHLQLHSLYRGNPVCSQEARAEGHCDDLVPVGTSPLNKHFWKIHGLVDEILGEWLNARGYREIAVDCGDRRSCYQWQGTWVGRYPLPN